MPSVATPSGESVSLIRDPIAEAHAMLRLSYVALYGLPDPGAENAVPGAVHLFHQRRPYLVLGLTCPH